MNGSLNHLLTQFVLKGKEMQLFCFVNIFIGKTVKIDNIVSKIVININVLFTGLLHKMNITFSIMMILGKEAL